MTFLAVKMENDPSARESIKLFRDRFYQQDGLAKNPFTGMVQTYTRKGEFVLVAAFDVIYPPVYLWALAPAALALLFHSTLLAVLAVILLATGIVRAPPLYYFVLRRACRKRGYNGPFRKLTPEEAFRWINGSA